MDFDAYKVDVPWTRDRAGREAHTKRVGEMTAKFRADLLNVFGVAGHPKASLCFQIAWSAGHSGGYPEVYHHFSEIVPLIQDDKTPLLYLARDINNVRITLMAIARLCAESAITHEQAAKELLDACDRLGDVARKALERDGKEAGE